MKRKKKQPIIESVYSVAEAQQLRSKITELEKLVYKTDWMTLVIEPNLYLREAYTASVTFDMRMIEPSFRYNANNAIANHRHFAYMIGQDIGRRVEYGIAKLLSEGVVR